MVGAFGGLWGMVSLRAEPAEIIQDQGLWPLVLEGTQVLTLKVMGNCHRVLFREGHGLTLMQNDP